MIRELYKLMDKTFAKAGEVPDEVSEVLIDGEEVFRCYEGGNDAVVFTDMRLIVKDTKLQKTEVISVPYSSVLVWSSENAGRMDKNSEITLWTEAEKIKVNLAPGTDIRAIDRFLALKIFR